MRLIPEPLQVQLLWLFWEQDFSIAWLRASHFLGSESAETQRQAETKSHLGPWITDWCMTRWRRLWIITLVLEGTEATSTEATLLFETNTQFPYVSFQLDPLGLTGTDPACPKQSLCISACHDVPWTNAQLFFFSSSDQHCPWEVLAAVVSRAGKAQRN